jgi:hypothetical protein
LFPRAADVGEKLVIKRWIAVLQVQRAMAMPFGFKAFTGRTLAIFRHCF